MHTRRGGARMSPLAFRTPQFREFTLAGGAGEKHRKTIATFQNLSFSVIIGSGLNWGTGGSGHAANDKRATNKATEHRRLERAGVVCATSCRWAARRSGGGRGVS